MKRIIIMINNWPFCTRDKAISQRKGKQIHIESVRIRTWNLLVASQTPYSLGVTESSSCAWSHLTFYILPVSPVVTYGPQCISPAAYLGRTSRSQQGSRWQPATLVSVLSQFSSVFILVGLSSLHSLFHTWKPDLQFCDCFFSIHDLYMSTACLLLEETVDCTSISHIAALLFNSPHSTVSNCFLNHLLSHESRQFYVVVVISSFCMQVNVGDCDGVAYC